MGLVCTRRFLIHECYDIFLFFFNYLTSFLLHFFPTKFTHTNDPRTLPTASTHDPRHLAILLNQLHFKVRLPLTLSRNV